MTTQRHTISLIGACVAFFIILAPPMFVHAWTASNAVIGYVQISDDGAVTAILGETEDGDEEVAVTGSNGERLWTFTYKETLSDVALSGNGRYAAVVGSGVHLLSIVDKKLVWDYPQDGRDAVAISTDGTWIVAGGYKAKVYVFKKNAPRVVKKWDLGKKEDSPRAVAISDDGKVVAASTNRAVYIFNTKSTKARWSAKTESGENVQELTMSRDGRYLFGLSAHTVSVWDTKRNAPLWKKEWKGLLIGAAMSAHGEKIVVSSQKGVSVFNTKGEELRHFDNEFGNSDVALSANGRYFYVNSGGTRLYAFDDSYSANDLRPFRIVRGTHAGGNPRRIATSGSGNTMTYSAEDNLHVEASTPAVLALSPGIPVLLKGATIDMGAFVTNPSIVAQGMKVRVSLGLAASAVWSKMTKGLSDRDPASVKSKILAAAADQLSGLSVIHEEQVPLAAGSSREIQFSATVPDLAGGSSFSDTLAGGMSILSPAALVSNLLDKIKGPLSKIIGNDAANLTIAVTNRTISGATGQMTYPMLGMGTVTLLDAQGNTADEDSFYFMYLQ